MIKFVIGIFVLIILSSLFILFNNQEKYISCITFNMNHVTDISFIEMVDITYKGLLNKEVLKIKTVKTYDKMNSTDFPDTEYYEILNKDGLRYKNALNNYHYTVIKDEQFMRYTLNSELYLRDNTSEQLSASPYNNVVLNNELNYDKLVESFEARKYECVES